jgi:hypothetical protein
MNYFTATTNSGSTSMSSADEFSHLVLAIFLGAILALITYGILSGNGPQLAAGFRSLLGLPKQQETYLRLDKHVHEALQHPPANAPHVWQSNSTRP